jgi:TPR repeat protein
VKKAAALDHIGAMNLLDQAGVMGLGVGKDLIKAHGCFNLAAASQPPDARPARAAVEKQLTPEQVVEAQRFVKAWRSVGLTDTAPAAPAAP